MCPITHISYVVLISTAIAAFIFGFLWYGPLFGKTWLQLMDKNPEECKGKKPPVGTMLLALLGSFLTTVVMGYLLKAASPCCNCSVAFMVWLGFYVPVLLGSVMWEGRPWKLFALNAAYYFLSLQLIAAILTNWK